MQGKWIFTVDYARHAQTNLEKCLINEHVKVCDFILSQNLKTV